MTIQHEGMYRDAETELYPASVLVMVNLTNETKGYNVYEDCTQLPLNDKPTFRFLQREYGRCTSKVYQEGDSGHFKDAKPIGWFFIAKKEYDRQWNESVEHYIQGAWVTFMELPALNFLPNTVREAQQGMLLAEVGIG